MDVEFRTKNGYRAKSTSAHMALIDWFINLHPDKDVYYFSPSEEEFIVQIISGIERQFNLTPVFKETLDHESKCKRLLLYLHEHGDILELRFAQGA